MKKLLFTTLVLLLGYISGGNWAMAQNGWEALKTQEQTTSPEWEKISESSTDGKVLGSAGVTSYYCVTKTLNFTNDRTDNGGKGNSGMKILGTVYLYLPAGVSITCRGANADGRTGAGAGIELSKDNTLYIIGGGEGASVTAIGGNAENGRNGGAGTNADGNSDDLWTGTGGTGGNGGGGAGAGIGTRGGNGGTGGSGGAGYKRDWTEYNGTNGSSGTGGSTAGAMGKLYVANGITVKATGGAAASSGGKGGERGDGFIWDGAGNNYTVAGGGGGGGGGFGGAASNIGTGGPGGGGGGGGAGGAQDKRANSKGGVYDVTAYGGKGGTNANGTSAADGAEANTTRSAYENGKVKSQGSTYQWKWNDWNSPSGDCTFGSGGSGGGCGNAASNGSTNAGTLEYTITYHYVLPSVRTETVKYSPSSGTPVILPQNDVEGYQWALGVYGRDCHATGDPSPFTTVTKDFFGGKIADTKSRTILLKDVYGNLDFYEVKSICVVEKSGDNTQQINDFFVADNKPSKDAPKWPITLRLKDRTLHKDGSWNTICLPFDMTADQYSASPLAGATIKMLSEDLTGYYPDGGKIGRASFDYPVIFFHFVDAAPGTKGLQRGKPYLVKWSSGNDLVDDTTEPSGAAALHQLDFKYVTVKETTPSAWEGNANYEGTVTFQGTFSSTQLKGGDNTKLILGADNTLYYPSTNLSVGSCRGYFIIPKAAAKTRGVVIGFDDGETTGIETLSIAPENYNDGQVYNLGGQRLTAPQKGINIINGKKVIIK